MLRNKSKDTDLSRRRFIQFMASASLASVGGVLSPSPAQAKPTSKRIAPMPRFKVRTSEKTAFERYQCKPDLAHFFAGDMIEDAGGDDRDYFHFGIHYLF